MTPSVTGRVWRGWPVTGPSTPTPFTPSERLLAAGRLGRGNRVPPRPARRGQQHRADRADLPRRHRLRLGPRRRGAIWAGRGRAGARAAGRRAVANERARIARELHDVVSQALGVIVMQAGGAGSVPALKEADAKAVLSTIEQTGRQAFAEMRRLVGVLRNDDEAAALAPQPTVGEIPALLARLARAGLDVDLEIEGTQPEAPAGVELSPYRIVQEALTTTLKHAAAAHATVRLVWSPDHLDVEVSDDGPAAGATVPPRVRADSGGKGLVGMRERVMLFGGDLEAAPSPHGG